MDKESWLASKVMGYKLRHSHKKTNYWYEKEDGEYIVSAKDWNPSENIEQAEQLIDKFDCYEINKVFIDYQVTVKKISVAHGVLSQAIVEVVLKVSGYHG